LFDLKDNQAKRIIVAKIKRIETDNYFGDHKSVGDGVFEMRIHCGAGYRIYYVHDGDTVIILLCGGDKSTQQKDIKKAKELLCQ
jgi:putative addiction module killer protein